LFIDETDKNDQDDRKLTPALPARADWILFTSFHASWDHNMMLSSANQGRRPEEFVKATIPEL